MSAEKISYDAIFRTDIAIIGICLSDDKLVKLDYLTNRKTRSARSSIAKKMQYSIESYLQAHACEMAVDKAVDKAMAIDVVLSGTPFQRKVLRQLMKIPYGETRTYGELAARLKTSPRAVGNACRRNPIPIVIPCHRVVAAGGLGGYDGAICGDKLDIKTRLLQLEGAI